MNKQSKIIAAVVFVPVLLGSSAWAAEKTRDAYLVAPDGSIVRNSSGECWRTSAWTAAAGAECNGAPRAAAPAPAIVNAEPAAKPATELASTAVPAATTTPAAASATIAIPASAESAATAATPVAAPAPVATQAPVIDTAPAMASVAPAPKETKPAAKNVTLSGAALFEFDRAELKPGAQKQLSELADKVKSQLDLDEVVITGYTDATGPETYNEDLSKKRAESVKGFLLQQGIVSKRVVIQALGEEKPVASNDTPEGRAQNRRVEVSIRAAGTK